MRLNAAAIVVVVLAGTLTSCRTGDVDTEPVAGTLPSTAATVQTPLPSTTINAATTSTNVVTTTTMGATTTIGGASTTTVTVPKRAETWVGFQRRDFPGYAVELVEVASGQRIVLALDRRSPTISQLVSDLDGGLIVAGGSPPFAPLQALAAGATQAVPLPTENDPIAFLDAVVDLDGAPTLLYRIVSREWDRDETDEWSETEVRLVARPLGGEPVVLAEGHSTWRLAGGQNLTTGSTPDDAGYGTGVLAVLWYVAEAPRRLELRYGFSDTPADVVIPDFEAGVEEPVDIVDVAVSTDGTVLFTLLFPSVDPARGGPDLVAWNLTDGTEIDRLSGTMLFVHDGDRTVAGDRRTQDSEVERFVARLGDDGFSWYETLDAAGSPPLGVITSGLRTAPDATLESTESWPQCSLGVVPEQPNLPQEVADTRTAIASAAARCDLLALFEVAATDPGFRIADGDDPCEPWLASIDDVDPVLHWYQGSIEFDEMAVIVEALSRPPSRVGSRYVWQDDHGYRIEIDGSGAWLLDWRSFPREPCQSILCTC